MKIFYTSVFLLVLSIIACKSNSEKEQTENSNENKLQSTFRIALGSCNRQDKSQSYWSVIQRDTADVFIWGGDNIYADTRDMRKMDSMYTVQKTNDFYRNFVESLPHPVLGVWDDHDYGKNDAGKEWTYKEESKAMFMDFFEMDSSHQIAQRAGTYYAKNFSVGEHDIKIYMLDSRYFRDGLLEADNPELRYQPHTSTDSTLLGNQQWKWLEDEMKSSEADFNIFVSSIQFLSNQHGFETWGNFPHEVLKIQQFLIDNDLKNILFLSGDRHISEFSQKPIEGLDYPLTDFTSSGLTHAYASFDGEPNPYRVGEVTAETSYGIVDLDLINETAEIKIKSTKDGRVLQRLNLNFRP
ncbi:alkaline phosphatase D family protein [Psychroflexus tropicus]|uniref:alkaline phosphatase D family protein n=1 Tax=Psychroflexus tropicus TaxID=197345 RepID=UPI00036AA564|nr:alkaline phosphatase D family protein [Psychroflexus tropicus]